MSGGTLYVHPAVLRSAGTSFGQAADGLGSLQADTPLSDSAAAVPSLQAAVAWRKAQSDVAAETAAVSDGARQFSENLEAAARWYRSAITPPPMRSRRSVVDHRR
jgi:Excreted virulence factor EspC, type VII ESX diderm